jgi:hypothetical protein
VLERWSVGAVLKILGESSRLLASLLLCFFFLTPLMVSLYFARLLLRSEEAGENPARSRHCDLPRPPWACGWKVRPSFVA